MILQNQDLNAFFDDKNEKELSTSRLGININDINSLIFKCTFSLIYLTITAFTFIT